jgi:hypothetical protein
MQRDAVKAHGLTGQLVTPDWWTLDLDELDRLLLRKSIRQTSSLLGSRQNPLLEEYRWLAYLRARPALVKKPLASWQTGTGSPPARRTFAELSLCSLPVPKQFVGLFGV